MGWASHRKSFKLIIERSLRKTRNIMVEIQRVKLVRTPLSINCNGGWTDGGYRTIKSLKTPPLAENRWVSFSVNRDYLHRLFLPLSHSSLRDWINEKGVRAKYGIQNGYGVNDYRFKGNSRINSRRKKREKKIPLHYTRRALTNPRIVYIWSINVDFLHLSRKRDIVSPFLDFPSLLFYCLAKLYFVGISHLLFRIPLSSHIYNRASKNHCLWNYSKF